MSEHKPEDAVSRTSYRRFPLIKIQYVRVQIRGKLNKITGQAYWRFSAFQHACGSLHWHRYSWEVLLVCWVFLSSWRTCPCPPVSGIVVMVGYSLGRGCSGGGDSGGRGQISLGSSPGLCHRCKLEYTKLIESTACSILFVFVCLLSPAFWCQTSAGIWCYSAPLYGFILFPSTRGLAARVRNIRAIMFSCSPLC